MTTNDENFIKDFNYRFNNYFSWTMNQEAKAELIAYLDKVRKEAHLAEPHIGVCFFCPPYEQ